MAEYPFSFGVVSNEIDQDLAVVLRVAEDLGMRTIELGSVWMKPPTQLSPQEVDRAEALVAESGIRVNMILSACLKSVRVAGIPVGGVAQDADFQAHMEELRRALALARRFDTAVRIFSFRREGLVGGGNPSPREPQGGTIAEETLAKVVEGLTVACEIAADYGVTLAVENVRSCYANTGTNLQRIVGAVDADNLRMIWDPANSFVSGQAAYPDGYQALDKSRIADVHIKDATLLDAATGLTDWTCVGEGQVDYAPQLAALARDGYRGPLTIETHWHPREYATRTTFGGLLRALQESAGLPPRRKG